MILYEKKHKLCKKDIFYSVVVVIYILYKEIGFCIIWFARARARAIIGSLLEETTRFVLDRSKLFLHRTGQYTIHIDVSC
jgi:hypothetical protein